MSINGLPSDGKNDDGRKDETEVDSGVEDDDDENDDDDDNIKIRHHTKFQLNISKRLEVIPS